MDVDMRLRPLVFGLTLVAAQGTRPILLSPVIAALAREEKYGCASQILVRDFVTCTYGMADAQVRNRGCVADVSGKSPVLSLAGLTSLSIAGDLHQVYVELGRYGIADPAADLAWLRRTLGKRWRWTQVGPIGNLVETGGRRHGLFIQQLVGLVPSLRALSLVKGFEQLLLPLIDRESFHATEFEIRIAIAILGAIGPFEMEIGPQVMVRGQTKRPDLRFRCGGRDVYAECKQMDPVEAVRTGIFNIASERFRDEVVRRRVVAPKPAVELHFHVGDGQAAEGLAVRLASRLDHLVRTRGWPSLVSHDLTVEGQLLAAAGTEPRPRTLGIRAATMVLRGVPPHERQGLDFRSSVGHVGWQRTATRKLIADALNQLPEGEPRIVFLDAPSLSIVLESALAWIDTSPRGVETGIVAKDAAGRLRGVGRISVPELREMFVWESLR